MEKKAALTCVVILAVLFGIGLAKREPRVPQDSGEAAAREEANRRRVLQELGIEDDEDGPFDDDEVTEKPDDRDLPVIPDYDGPIGASKPSIRLVVVRPMDTFSSIARRELGDPNLYHVLQKANPGVNPRRLRIGSKIRVPREAGAVAQGEVVDAPRRQKRTYRVRRHETLGDIARKEYGSFRHWKKILAANSDLIARDRDLREGMLIRLP